MAKTSVLIGTLAILCAIFVACSTAADNSTWTVYYNPTTQAYSVQQKLDPISGVAWATLADERLTTGWARLILDSNPVYSDNVIAYGAGYLEGFITNAMIHQSWVNTLANSFGNRAPNPQLQKFFQTTLNWSQDQVKRYPTSAQWQQVGLVLQQLEGMTAGYNAAASSANKLNVIDFIVLNSGGDLETIEAKFANTTQMRRTFGTHCSSAIKVTPDLMELFAGHTTWSPFWTMLRVFKSYTLRFRTQGTNALTTLFSSYPGVISSIDDFYQLHPTQLVVLETTNGIVDNPSLFQKVTPESLLSWIRVIVSNRMAVSAANWVSIFSNYNSGTYNNQWIVVDYKLFTPGTPLKDGLLWIAEQIPGYIHSGDVTSYLRNGYWPSYNIPFFQDIYNISGFPTAIQTIGDWLTYDLHPRAQIFRRDANKVATFEEYQALLRYNNWEHDPLADGNPGNQISSRFDLVPKNQVITNPYLVRAAFGGTDSKATSHAHITQRRCFAQSGPSHDNQVPFTWGSANEWNMVHEGLPETFNFPWINMPHN